MREAETAVIAEIKGDIKWHKWEEQIKSRICKRADGKRMVPAKQCK